MEEVYQNIFLIKEKGGWGAFKPTQNIYILAGNNGLIYDAGYGNKKTVKYLVNQIKKLKNQYIEKEKEFEISRLLVSHAHPDHFSGSIKIREYLEVKILLTEKTAKKVHDEESFLKNSESSNEKKIRNKKTLISRIKDFFLNKFTRFFYKRVYGLAFIKNPDKIVPEDSEILINGEKWKIFPSPGHSSDHISLYSEKEGILFSGDNVLRTITTWLGPPDSSLEDYIETIKQISKLPKLELILSAHGDPIKNPKQRLKEIIEHRKKRTKQIEDLVIKSERYGITPKTIIRELYPGEGMIKHQMAKGYVMLTLQYLEKNKKIYSKIDKKNKKKFFPFEN